MPYIHFYLLNSLHSIPELVGLDFKLGEYLYCLCPARNHLPDYMQVDAEAFVRKVVQHWKKGKQLTKIAKLRESKYFLHRCHSKEQCSSGAAKWACLKSCLSHLDMLMSSFSLSTVQLRVKLISGPSDKWPTLTEGKITSFLLTQRYKRPYFHSPTHSIQSTSLSSDWTAEYEKGG